jgi:hypothetical protein
VSATGEANNFFRASLNIGMSRQVVSRDEEGLTGKAASTQMPLLHCNLFRHTPSFD